MEAALAAVTALQFARELDISEVVLEGDSEIIITALTDEHYPLTTYDLILQDANLLNYVTLTLGKKVIWSLTI